uniref:Genome polyprotein n=78 Tax=Porcine kobuvirus TaxID=1156769 RepID=A0A5Q2V4B3_9PICO|nr:polyprotein [Porcine kobuvirus]
MASSILVSDSVFAPFLTHKLSRRIRRHPVAWHPRENSRLSYITAMEELDACYINEQHRLFPSPRPSHWYNCLYCQHPSEDGDTLMSLACEYDEDCPTTLPLSTPKKPVQKDPEDILEDSEWPDNILHPEPPSFTTDAEQNWLDCLASASLPGPTQVRPLSKFFAENPPPASLAGRINLSDFSDLILATPCQIVRQGNSTTNIYGSNNNVTTDVGANGWTPTVNTGLGDGPVSSSADDLAGRSGGSSTASKDSSKSSKVKVHNFNHWWEPAAAKALSRGVDKVLDGVEGAGKLAGSAIKSKLSGARPGPSPNFIALNPSATQSGNAMITTGSTAPVVVAYPPTPSVPLPNPDAPSQPGPSGDRTWLLDSLEWTTEDHPLWCLAGPTGMQNSALEKLTFPVSSLANWGNQNYSPPTAYPLPFSFVHAYPDCPWTAMHNTHSMWNCGWRIQVVVNGSQFHAGCLALVMIPEYSDGDLNQNRLNAVFTFPYALLNLYQGNTASFEVPYIGPTPNSSTCVRAPWTFYLMVLTPLSVPTGSPTSLSVSIYVTPLNTSFHGLRQVQTQHWKIRSLPGAGAFGNVVAGQEIPIYAMESFRPPVDYLPAKVSDWLEFAHRPGLFESFTWTMAETAGEKIAEAVIEPVLLAATGTPISFVTNLFAQWRGELQLSLLFTGSAQHFGRLAICFTPASGAPPTSLQDALRGTYTVWDINSSSTLDFTIPFISQSYWKVTNIANQNSLLATLGTVSIWVMNPLTGPSSAPPSAVIQAFVSAGESFTLRGIQAPGFQIQAADDADAPTPVSNIESGSATTVPEPRTNFSYTDNPTPPDTNLQRFFSIYRPIFVNGENYSVGFTAGTGYTFPLNPVDWVAVAGPGDTLPLLLSCFTYFTGDPRVALTFSNPAPFAACITIYFAPPGSSPQTGDTSAASMGCFYSVQTSVPPTSEATIPISIPYASPLSAIPLSFFGFSDFAGGHDVVNTTLGTLYIRVTFQGEVPDPTYITIDAQIAFGNFCGYVPRAPPPLGTSPTPTVAVVRPKGRSPIVRQCRTTDVPTPTLCPDVRVYIVKVQCMTYTHWALRAVHSDRTEQISLSRFGLNAYVAYEDPTGVVYQEVEPHHWMVAVAMVGTRWDYSATNNCTHFVSNITGVHLPNTGFSLLLGLGALALLSGCVAVQASKGGVIRQGLLSLEAPPEVVQAANRVATSIETTASVMLEAVLAQSTVNIVQAANRVADSIETTASAVREADLARSTLNISMAASDIRMAATQVSSSLNGFTDMLSSFSKTFTQGASKMLSDGISTFLTWVAKVFGYLLVLFGSPTPMSIAGLLVIICADLAPQASEYFHSCSSVLGSLYYWIATKLGLSVTPEEAHAATVEHQGVRDYNDAVNAVKNTEWLMDTCWRWAERVLTWIRGKAKTDPQTVLADAHDEILRHYSESIAALSSERTPVSAITDAITRCRELTKVAADAKSAPHSSFLSQALRNYQLALNSARMAQSGPRPEPVVIYLYGPPGTGKSLLASLLARVLAQKLSGNPDDVYSPSSASCEYFDGYTGQVVHFIDDLGQDPEGRDWANFPNLISSAPFIVPMANLEAKGTHYTSQVVVVTSNFAGPNERAARSIGALRRRMHLRINVDRIDAKPFDPVEALKPLNQPSKYLTSQTELSLFKSFKLTVAVDSLWQPSFTDFDSLVDAIVARLDRSTGVSDFLASLVKRQGLTIEAEPTELSYQDALEILSESKPVPTSLSFERAVSQNAPLSVVNQLWNYRKPIFACTTFLTVIGFVLTIIAVARTLWKAKEDAPDKAQGAYSGLPRLKRQEKVRPSHPPPPPPSQSRSVVRQSLSPALPKIADNVYSIATKSPSMGRSVSCGFFLFSRFFLAPTHIIPDDTTRISFGPDNFDWATLQHRRLGKELTIIHFPTIRQHRDLRRFIGYHPYPTGHLISTLSGPPVYLRFSKNRWVTLDLPGVVEEPKAYGYKAPTFQGLCGAPLITDDPAGVKLLGLHVAGVTGCSGFSVPISTYLPEIEQFAIDQQSIIIPGPNIVPGVNVNRKSKLGRSPAFGAFPVKKQPAVLTQKDDRLEEGIRLDDQLFLKHNKGDMDQPWPGLEAAADLYFSKFPTMIHTLTMEEAINGTPNLEGIDMNQAAGYPWNTMGRSRRSLFVQQNGIWLPLPELEAEINKTLEDPFYFYSTFLKDELRPTSKVTLGLTRVVEAAPVHAIVAGRMLLGGLIEYMQANPGKHGSAVGCNPDLHWTKFFFKFCQYPQVFDLDYKCFDATLPSCAFRIVEKHLERLIGDERVTRYIETIRHSRHVFGNETYEMIGGNPSGCVGTSIINTIINNVCVLSALIQHPDFSPESFRILAYGDDVIYGCDPPIHPSFIKEFYDKHTPLVVTPANKTDTFPENSTIYDVTFLKRWFVPDDIRPFYIHPVMDPDTYEQSVMWLRDGDFQDLVTSLCYLAFHSGPKTYDRWCTRVRDQVMKTTGFPPTFLPYSYLQTRWLNLLAA